MFPKRFEPFQLLYDLVPTFSDLGRHLFEFTPPMMQSKSRFQFGGREVPRSAFRRFG
jgi:hypothetical protein